jgi:hypothetical protein
MKNRIIIDVSGGVVQCVYADNPKNLEIILFDEDNLKEETGKTRDDLTKEWKKLTKGTIHIF